jgi:predicted Rossmann fold flavoprotein
MDLKHKLLIIGGGAAGLMAAVTAKDLGMDVAILEGNDHIGVKILNTGNGQCNITNGTLDSDNIREWYHSSNEGFPAYALRAFTVEQTIEFFTMLGLPLTTTDEGRMYPMSMQASSVVDIFQFALDDRGIPLYLKHKVTGIVPNVHQGGFTVVCQTDAGEETFTCGKLLLASGGLAAPNTGSDGSGYTFAKSLGHRMITPLPVLVQLKLDSRNLKAMSNIKFEGRAQVLVKGKIATSKTGEMHYTDYGISGPTILSLSRTASRHLSGRDPVTLKVDMMPGRSDEELEQFLEAHWGVFGHRSVLDSLLGIINKKLIPVLLKEAGVENIHKPCWELSWKEKRGIYKSIKHREASITDTNSFNNAQVTAGGIDTRDVDPATLESKLVPGLYFAGEILDVDGDIGGYNLQWAWSSGYAAAKAASE